jgi:hypothetical protein
MEEVSSPIPNIFTVLYQIYIVSQVFFRIFVWPVTNALADPWKLGKQSPYQKRYYVC